MVLCSASLLDSHRYFDTCSRRNARPTQTTAARAVRLDAHDSMSITATIVAVIASIALPDTRNPCYCSYTGAPLVDGASNLLEVATSRQIRAARSSRGPCGRATRPVAAAHTSVTPPIPAGCLIHHDGTRGMLLKDLERAWRRLWVRLLTGALRATGRRGGSSEPPRLRRILFLRPDRIGDMIVSTGVLRAIASSDPEIQVDVLASPANAPVARGEPFIGRVHVLDRRHPIRALRSMLGVRGVHYDAVVDCMPTAPSVTTLLLMLASGARERIGVAGRGNDAALTIAVAPRADARHIIDHLSALASPFGLDERTADFAPALTLSAEERARASATWQAYGQGRARNPRRFLVNVSAGKAVRYWPNERFVEIMRRAAAQHPNLSMVVIGGPADIDRATAVAAAANASVVPTKTLREALALIATADAVLSADTGLAHAASALRRPAVVMHVHGTSTLWGLYGAPGHALESIDGTLVSLSVEPVWRAVDAILRPSAKAPLADENGRGRRSPRTRQPDAEPLA
jgi:ADP-heptose:LPS heptosyltransferase